MTGVFAVLREELLGVVKDAGMLRPFLGVTNLDRSAFESLEENASSFLPGVAKKVSETESDVGSRRKNERLALLCDWEKWCVSQRDGISVIAYALRTQSEPSLGLQGAMLHWRAGLLEVELCALEGSDWARMAWQSNFVSDCQRASD